MPDRGYANFLELRKAEVYVGESTFRNCPKSLGGVYSVALLTRRAGMFSAHFAFLITGKSTFGALLTPLFGQFLHARL